MAALMALENRFPKPLIDGPVTGIVVLGGAVDTHVSVDRQTLAMNEAGERLTEAVDLSRRYPDARIFLSGGCNHIISQNQTTESQVARDILVMLGVPAQRIEMAERSRTTCENAIESKAVLIQPKPGELWLLVTSASHMPQAMACLRAVGFKVAAYPVDYRTRGKVDRWRPTRTAAAGLSAAGLAARMAGAADLLVFRKNRRTQRPLWDAVAEALRANARSAKDMMAKMPGGMMSGDTTAETPMERIEVHERMLSTRLEGLRRLRVPWSPSTLRWTMPRRRWPTGCSCRHRWA
ncbi:ElyC/SanA/YdcF family protein [Mesorhizobium sp. WSM4884]|uniref:ElyC/SanA/YdcF family protein n=1 Tax=Mesorhizobium sp. WSM4884 TaxID=3038542 RepID=UPI002416AC48|nr:ElyC/SanA/YdcF family protein [Mesorhizobium sp. WSM4884]MDG4881858.1 ElyC/SanA/YdcF family protein [Mesorhizobium sp. WSM4884]